MVRRLPQVSVAAAVAFAAAPVAAGQAPRACTAAELAGVRGPLQVEAGRGRGSYEPEFVVAGRPYRAVVVRELAIGDTRGPVDGSFEVTGPSGVKLTPGRAGGRPVWGFTAPGRGR